MNQITVLTLDHNEIFRKGLRKLLNEIPHINVIMDCENPQAAINFIKERTVDFVIMDSTIREFLHRDFIKLIQSINPNIKIIILTREQDENFILEMVKKGVSSFLSKNISLTELVEAIDTIKMGESYFPKKISSIIFKHLANPVPQSSHASHEGVSLTAREKEILEYISKEFTNKEIASKLFISRRTVDTHRRNLLLKLDVKNTAGLVRYYYSVMNGNQRENQLS